MLPLSALTCAALSYPLGPSPLRAPQAEARGTNHVAGEYAQRRVREAVQGYPSEGGACEREPPARPRTRVSIETFFRIEEKLAFGEAAQLARFAHDRSVFVPPTASPVTR